jgi:hypothetical protein
VKGAREFYEKHFQWEMNTVKLEQFYRTVLGGKNMTNEVVEKGPDPAVFTDCHALS